MCNNFCLECIQLLLSISDITIFERDNLIGAPRESRLKGASRDSKARVATQRRESRLKGASRDSMGASRDSKARVATQRRDSRKNIA